MYYRVNRLSQARDWEKFRFLAWANWKLHDKDNKFPDPTSIMTLESDPTAEEIKDMQARQAAQDKEEFERIKENYRSRGLL